jgi:MFS family permease
MAFVVGTTLITQPGGRVAGGLLLGACLVLAGGFVLVDRRAAAPLLPPELIRSRWLRLGALGGLLNTATTSSVITLVTLYLQNSLGRTPWQAAASLLPFSLAVIAGSTLAARVQHRAEPPRQVARRLIAAGLALIAVADAALIPLAARVWAVPLCGAAAGAGIGLSSVAATGLGTDVEPRWRGGASGIINTAAQLGTAVGIATLLLVAAATSGTPAPDTSPPRIAWAVAALAAAAGAAWFAFGRRGVGLGGKDGRAAGRDQAAGRDSPAGRDGTARPGRTAGPVREDAFHGRSDRIAAGRGRRSGSPRGTERG